MRKIALGLGVAASAIAVPAAARNGEVYFGAEYGVVFPNEYNSDVSGVSNAVTTESEPGWEVGGRLGYDFGPIRTEIEGSYKEFDAEQFTSIPGSGLPRGGGVPIAGTTTGFGEHRFTSVMLNALVDFGGEDGIGFSVGGGAGHTWAGLDLATTNAPKAVYLNDEAHDWAWQAIAELRVPVNDHAELGLKYKYFNTSELRFVDTLGRQTDIDFTTHSALLSLTYNFGGAAPPPPPPVVAPPPPPRAAPCNTGPYIVFFDWDKSDITPEAATVLNSAVTAYGDCGTASIMLAGHADRSGAATYNVGLSQRRNVAVNSYLTGRGIPAARISSQAFGETMNRVATVDGVRELQNRRVEVTYGPGSGR